MTAEAADSELRDAVERVAVILRALEVPRAQERIDAALRLLDADTVPPTREALERFLSVQPGAHPHLRAVPRGRCAHVLGLTAVCSLCGAACGLDADGLDDAFDVAAQGRNIAAQGIPWAVEGVVPQLGMLGFLVAYAKVGKTTLGQALGGAVARGRPFLGRPTTRARVLYIAAEDPPEYTAWLARHLDAQPREMTFFRRSIVLTDENLARVSATVRAGGYGLVLIASWQAIVRGLIRDENDNAGAVSVVERVKAAARETRIPWILDAHSGKAEDQSDDADPSKAMRGASAAAASADYTLWLRFANGAYGTQRRLSARGRFVTLPPTLIDYDATTGTYSALGSTKSAAADTDWRLIDETAGALTATPASADVIARVLGWIGPSGRVSGASRRRVCAALRANTGIVEEVSVTRENGQRDSRFRRREGS